ncbi:hypothetical protein [Halobaculum sp. MBLA0143]|uniref:DUF6895 family protein n=1 Tax=Halobaculum sp. MBLA0143 TaxID=3079933 RepID=UPI003523BEF9
MADRRHQLTEQAARLTTANDEWLADHTPAFDPLGWTDTDAIEYRRKAFSELALYVYVADCLSPAAPEPLTAVVDETLQREAYVDLLRRDPTKLLRYAPALTVGLARDTVGESVREAVTTAVTHPAVTGTEWLANRRLDVARLAALAGREPQVDPAAVLARSAVAGDPVPIRGSRMDAYALTHAILFATDFGTERQPLGNLAAHDFQTALDGYLLRFVADGHTDVAAELVLCGVVTGQVSPALVEWTLNWLHEETTELGHTPGPEVVTAPPTLTGPTPDDDDPESFDPESVGLPSTWLEDYHTALVGGMLGRVVSHHGDRLDWEGAATADPEALSALGAALEAFADYELQDGAERLVELSDHTLPTSLTPVVERVEAFLREQRDDDGQFGYWTDERHMFELAGHDAAAFEAGPLARTTAACEDGLVAVTEITETHDT